FQRGGREEGGGGGGERPPGATGDRGRARLELAAPCNRRHRESATTITPPTSKTFWTRLRKTDHGAFGTARSNRIASTSTAPGRGSAAKSRATSHASPVSCRTTK